MHRGPDPALAAAAADEAAARRKQWPARVAQGAMTHDQAQADIAAWDALATLYSAGRVETELTWEDLRAALQAGLDRRVAAANRLGPDRPPALEARISAIWTMLRNARRRAFRGGYALHPISAPPSAEAA